MIGALANKVRSLREERGWTQEELSLKTGIGRSYISLLETGKVGRPSAEYLVKLAGAFNIHPEELYEAAGYIKEAKTAYIYKETPGQILDNVKLNIRRLEKLLNQKGKRGKGKR